MPSTNLWPRVEPLLARVERPARYLNHEWGCVVKDDAPFQFCMIYPDTYELGQANQAVRILVNAVNATEGMGAERAFLPAVDMADLMRDAGVPLFSLESCAPVAEFDAVGITLPHELAATNILETLDLAGIPLHSAERAEDDPIVLAGGPCAYNPEPYAPFFDVILVGEGEEQLPEALSLIRRLRSEAAPRADILRALAREVGGAYVPSLYRWRDEAEAQAAGSWVEPLFDDVPPVVDKRVFEDFAASDAHEPMVVPYTEVVHDRLNIEVLRGCARGCRFCQAGMMYRPVRERSADNIVNAVVRGLAETGYDEVSLTSLSSTDHSQIAEILTRVNDACAGRGVRVSVPSQRLDAFGVEMAELVAGQKKGGLTFAPEAGTQRLRDVINKNVTEDDLFSAIDAAFAAGWRRCKLYFMVGLPTETDEDIKGIASLAQRAYDRAKAAVPPEQRGSVRMSVSCAVFVPKAQTPFQWDGQISPEETLRRVGLLKRSVKYKAVDVHYHDPATSFVEAVMSRGGREAAAWVEEAWRRGARFDAWTEHFNEEAWTGAAEALGIDPARIAQADFPTDYVLPWAHITAAVSPKFLARERARAQEGVTTPDCTFENCSACGACPTLGADIELMEERVGKTGAGAANPYRRVIGSAAMGDADHVDGGSADERKGN
ncbi:MAG: TIGR03960 family B12-binding radical SAM protein [Adlercreutzia caecimuris]|uniref:TIGR03960 family B12-binding radical SAM protein n=1 Tax=Adlercreutzia caecimuris TaxID=671266 RepID=UPI00243129B7|nr:TIGR03960 family B12-binding radical SAM protein [Adlercreutzia caecimuris]MCI9208976.1 TIGR03960 family B12-binding radical SAM protein [Adlercreutzia caecimuris]